ncbi:MAG: hypothetical protein AAF219_10265 [Myxococcota bacterium]
MTPIDPDLQSVIDSSVERIVEASYQAAIAAVERAFHRDVKVSSRRAAKRRAASSNHSRRSSAEIDRLAQRLLTAIRNEPGAGMSVLASRLHTSSRSLQPVVARLKAQRAIRSVGQRRQTRYFPLSSKSRR